MGMPWYELKDLGRQLGASVVHSSTFISHGVMCGSLTFLDWADADRAVHALQHRRFEGSAARVRCWHA